KFYIYLFYVFQGTVERHTVGYYSKIAIGKRAHVWLRDFDAGERAFGGKDIAQGWIALPCFAKDDARRPAFVQGRTCWRPREEILPDHKDGRRTESGLRGGVEGFYCDVEQDRISSAQHGMKLSSQQITIIRETI